MVHQVTIAKQIRFAQIVWKVEAISIISWVIFFSILFIFRRRPSSTHQRNIESHFEADEQNRKCHINTACLVLLNHHRVHRHNTGHFCHESAAVQLCRAPLAAQWPIQIQTQCSGHKYKTHAWHETQWNDICANATTWWSLFCTQR